MHSSKTVHSHARSVYLQANVPCCCRYVYLLDNRGRVRWRASGGAQGTEADALLQAAEQLLDGA